MEKIDSFVNRVTPIQFCLLIQSDFSSFAYSENLKFWKNENEQSTSGNYFFFF